MAGCAGDVDHPSETLAAPRSRDQIRQAPKALLHDHLDGGLRPADCRSSSPTSAGTQLPADEAGALGRWFTEAADSGSLERYLETFDHTVARHADRTRRSAGSPASASRTSPTTASSTPRCATPPSSTSATG